jgi:putative solute:sodium symporter small subunit
MPHQPPPPAQQPPSPTPDGSRRAAPYDLLQPEIHKATKRYWRSNVRLMLILLLVWAVVGLGCGVIWADRLNALEINGEPFRLGGFPLGFWFAQQGSIIVFTVLILIYAVVMNRLDNRHHLHIEQLRREREG